MAGPAFLSEAVRAVLALLEEHNPYGGVRLDFLQDLDRVAHDHLIAIPGRDATSFRTREWRARRSSWRDISTFARRGHFYFAATLTNLTKLTNN